MNPFLTGLVTAVILCVIIFVSEILLVLRVAKLRISGHGFVSWVMILQFLLPPFSALGFWIFENLWLIFDETPPETFGLFGDMRSMDHFVRFIGLLAVAEVVLVTTFFVACIRMRFLGHFTKRLT